MKATNDMPRWVTWVTWIAILAPLPYSVSRLLWAAGIDVGLQEEGAGELDTPGWISLYLVLLAALTEATGLFVHRFVLRGAPARPWFVIGPLLLPISILIPSNIHTARWFLDGFELPPLGGVPQDWWSNWGVWGAAAVFWVWGLALIAATWAYYRRTRPHMA
jgi:hypothetical protein